MVNINDKITISKNYNTYTVFITDKKGQDIFINGKLAKLVLEKDQPIYNTLDSKIGYIDFSPEQRKFKFVISRYVRESEDYSSKIQGDNFGDRFGEWTIEGVLEQHLNYILETIYYKRKQEKARFAKHFKG